MPECEHAIDREVRCFKCQNEAADRGFARGHTKGYKEGYDEGVTERQEDIVQWLRDEGHDKIADAIERGEAIVVEAG